jgi:hypothetical protein
MKNQTQNKSRTGRSNLFITAHVGEAIRVLKKKTNWQTKTAKLTKTCAPRVLKPRHNGLTEDDIDKLFGNHALKDTPPAHHKLSTEVDEGWGPIDDRDFVTRVRFLNLENVDDELLSGLPKSETPMPLAGEEAPSKDLSAEFRKQYLVGKVVGEGAYATVRVATHKPKKLKVALKIYEKATIREVQKRKAVRR